MRKRDQNTSVDDYWWAWHNAGFSSCVQRDDLKCVGIKIQNLLPQSWYAWHHALLQWRALPQSVSASHHPQSACTTWPDESCLLDSELR